MDGIDLALARQRHDRVDVKVSAQGLAGRADAIGFVRLEAVQREAILVSVDRDIADAQFVRRAKHANGDLAAIRDHDLANRLDDGRGRRLRVRHFAAILAMASGLCVSFLWATLVSGEWWLVSGGKIAFCVIHHSPRTTHRSPFAAIITLCTSEQSL
jgi:hypothetical protein